MVRAHLVSEEVLVAVKALEEFMGAKHLLRTLTDDVVQLDELLLVLGLPAGLLAFPVRLVEGDSGGHGRDR